MGGSMLPLLLAAALSSTPRAHPDADLAVYVPRLDRMGPLTSFLRTAGTRSVLLRPESWRGEFCPILRVDPTRAESLAAAGIDPTGPATVSFARRARITCFRTQKHFEARAKERFGERGELWTAKAKGASLLGVRLMKTLVAGSAIRGGEACVVEGSGGDVEPLVRALPRLLEARGPRREWRALTSLDGVAFVLSRDGVAGLNGDEKQLRAEGRTRALPALELRAGGMSPYAAMTPSGLAFLRAQIAPSGREALVRVLRDQLGVVCRDCDRAAIGEAAAAIAPSLTGHVLLRVDSVKVRDSLRSASARYFAVRHAYLVELSDPAAVSKVVARTHTWRSARKTEDGVALTAPGGEILIGIRGSHLYVANAQEAVDAAFQALPEKKQKLAHGAEFALDPKQVAKGFQQIGLFDVVGSQELAALFAAGTELGPLLAASERISGWIDPAGAGVQRFHATWVLH